VYKTLTDATHRTPNFYFPL